MIRDKLAKLVLDLANEHYGTNIISTHIDYSESEFGDFSSNIAFELSRTLKTSPREIANTLAPLIKESYIEKVEAAGSGYINITMNQNYWLEIIKGINSDYLKNNLGNNNKLQIEFISANPTGPLTLANARGGFLGDVLANIYTKCGYIVTKEYYVNDGGVQIGKLVESIKAEAGLINPENRQYSGEYIKDLVKAINKDDLNDDSKLAKTAVALLIEEIKKAVNTLGINFNVWFSEQSLIDDGSVKDVIDLLEKMQLSYEKDNATWIKSSIYGDERDRVIVKSDGSYTYLLNDIAYHVNIFNKRNFDRSIKLWGADHAGQVESLKLTIKELIPRAELDFILIQFVRLMSEGIEVKMSKRAGTYVTIDELIKNLESAVGREYASSVARWFFLSRSSDNRIDFDLTLASQQSSQNPYFYVMYSYARAHSIIGKAKENDIFSSNSIDYLNEYEINLVKTMSKLPELIKNIASDHEVHKLLFYGSEIARLFQTYYENERIINLPKEVAEKKLYFISQYILFMDQYWAILGILPVEHL